MGNCDGGSEASGGTRRALVAVPRDGLWTAAQVAAFLGCSTDWVYKQVRTAEEGGLPFIRLGRRNYRFDPAKVREWVAARASGGEE